MSEERIQDILRLAENKDYLKLFELPKPYLDPLGRMTWDFTDADVQKKYRRVRSLPLSMYQPRTYTVSPRPCNRRSRASLFSMLKCTVGDSLSRRQERR